MTLRLTIDYQAELLRFAADGLGLEDGFVPDSHAVGVIEEDGRIRAVGVLNMFHDQGAWIHLATDGSFRWATRPILAGLFSYPFVTLGLRRVTARVEIGNVPAQILCLRLGFRIEGVEREGFCGRDVAIFAMFARECPWLEAGE